MTSRALPRARSLLLALALTASAGGAAAAAPGSGDGNSVGQATTAPITEGTAYDRNPSVVADGDTTWMFFARTELAECNRLDGCNADNTTYDLYARRSSDGGATWGADELIADNPHAGSFYGRTVAATRMADGTLAVFWASGGNGGPLYWLTRPAGGDWSAVSSLDDTLYFNVEAVAQGDTVFVYFEDAFGNGIHVRTFDGTAFGPATLVVPGRNIPKVIVDRWGTFRMAMVDASAWPVVNVEVASSPDGTTWSAPQVVVAGDGTVTNWDPTLGQTSDGRFHLFYAPDDNTGTQRIARLRSADFVTWTDAGHVTGVDTSGWWDYWPELSVDGGLVRLYYTSEAPTTGTTAGTGHIWTRLFSTGQLK